MLKIILSFLRILQIVYVKQMPRLSHSYFESPLYPVLNTSLFETDQNCAQHIYSVRIIMHNATLCAFLYMFELKVWVKQLKQAVKNK